MINIFVKFLRNDQIPNVSAVCLHCVTGDMNGRIKNKFITLLDPTTTR